MKLNRKFSLEMLEELCVANGVPGYEDEVIAIGKKYASNVANISENFMRNLYLSSKKNSGKKPVVMIDGHSDELGLIVQKINPNGTLSFLTLGGWVPSSLPSQKFRILNDDGEYISGIVASKPPHFMTSEERTKPISISDLIIDVGASSKEELVNDFKISIGAPCVPDIGFEYNERNGVVLTKALDNRVACAAIIDVLRIIQDLDLDVDVVGSFSSQEEIGERGIKSAVAHIKPDVAIVLEGTPSDDTFMSKNDAQAIMHGGTQIRCFDKSMITNPKYNKFVRNLADTHNIKYQLAVRSGGSTDAGEIHTSFEGIPSVVFGVPTRYAHSHNCFCAMDDYDSTVNLVVEVLKALNKEIIENF